MLYADEVDVHLNPKIGRDWMLPGQQRRIVTPGKNEKFYLAGALDVRTGKLHTTGAAAGRRGIELARERDADCPERHHVRREPLSARHELRSVCPLQGDQAGRHVDDDPHHGLGREHGEPQPGQPRLRRRYYHQ